MREALPRQGDISVVGVESSSSNAELGSRTQFAASGPLPPVASNGGGGGVPTASELAFGSDSEHATFGTSPSGKARVPTSRIPLTKEADLEAVTTRRNVEAMLKSTGGGASEAAARALDSLVNLPDTHRGQVLDGLDAQSFENLLERISDHQRERFFELASVAQKPERRLRLWAEAHKARATSNIERHKGDIGAPIPMERGEYEGGGEFEKVDDDREADIRAGLTKEQLRNRKRHVRREAAAAITHEEIDDEVKVLMAKAKKGQLTLKDVDDVRERKDLEYKIELETNVNLTAEAAHYRNGDPVRWSKRELGEVERVLTRLPHAQDPDSVGEVRRTMSRGIDGIGGVAHRNRIDITDFGADSEPGYRHGGDQREGVSDSFKKQHGDKIGTLEFVLTHEMGHEVADRNPAAFDAFCAAAGWERVKVDALRRDGVTDKGLAELEKQRENPNAKEGEVTGKTRMYSPIKHSDEYWAIPTTAIPARDEAVPGTRKEDTWQYARVEPREHFAEVYAKAVHVPAKLHDELILRPSEKATNARNEHDRVEQLVRTVEAEPPSPHRDLKLFGLQAMLRSLKEAMLAAEAAREQRAKEFAVMRDTVFGTDRAVELAIARLTAKKLAPTRIAEFKRRVAEVSTPEQVALVEAEVSK